jgi:membrane-associated phospholipid phosphatase
VRTRSSAVLATLFLVTAALVAAGVFHGADQYAVSHWMPWSHPRRHRLLALRGLFLPATSGSVARRALEVWIYPASVFVSGVIVAWIGLRTRSLVWPALWIAGNAIELAGKLIVRRPALFHDGLHVVAFDHSLPSGHTIRAFVLAGALAWTWRRGRLAFVWAVTVPVVLVLLGAHAPLDVVAGAFVAAALLSWPRRDAQLY